MPILTADNKNLLKGAKYTYLNANTASAVTTIIVKDDGDFVPNDFILIGEIGSTRAEIIKISSIARTTKTLTLQYATKFSHSESTKITKVNYDMIRFFRTTTSTFSLSGPLLEAVSLGSETTQIDITNPSGTTFRYTWDGTGTDPKFAKYQMGSYSVVINGSNFNSANNLTATVTGTGTNYFEITNAAGVIESNVTIGTGTIKVSTNYIDLDPSKFVTQLTDSTNSTGFGWFVFYNSVTGSVSGNSNAIPYAGFSENSVKAILDSFFNLLNNKELKLIRREDALEWLNEGYSVARSELNLINREYSGAAPDTIAVVSGTKEYDLETDFSDLLSVVNATSGSEVQKINLSDVSNYDAITTNPAKYYLRGSVIGFTPTPTASATYTARYLAKTTKLTSLYDNVDLPNNDFYCLKDYMLYRSSPKLGRGDGMQYLGLFNEAIKRMKLGVVTRTSRGDTWEIDPAANI